MLEAEAEAQLKCQKLLNVIDATGWRRVIMWNSLRCHRRIPSLMQPAFIIRRSLRMKCMDQTAWKSAGDAQAQVELHVTACSMACRLQNSRVDHAGNKFWKRCCKIRPKQKRRRVASQVKGYPGPDGAGRSRDS